MKLTSEMVASYIGGQLEVQNHSKGYLGCGEIKTGTIEGTGNNATLKVVLTWRARSEGHPLRSHWVNDTNLTYEAKLLTYVVYRIGGDRILLQSSIVGEIVILSLPNDSTLDPSSVEGLTRTE